MVAVDHVAHDVLGQVHGAAHVEVDEPQLVLEPRVGRKRAAGADAGVERDGVHRSPGRRDAPVELVDTPVAGEVDLHRLDADAVLGELAGGGVDRLVLGGDDEVVLGELPGKLEADAARGAGDDGEPAAGGCGRSHGAGGSRCPGPASLA
jgi:hypothetical protein